MNDISDEIALDINVMSLFPTGLPTIFCKMHGAFIVLEDHVITDRIPLGFKKMLNP